MMQEKQADLDIKLKAQKLTKMPKFRIALGEVIHRFNIGAAQMSTKAAMFMAGPLLRAYIPGGMRLGRIDLAREDITKEFMAQRDDLRLTHLLFLDQDMEHPPDLVHRLASHDLPLVAALYIQRNEGKPMPLMFNFKEDGCHIVAAWEKGELVECDATGGGAVLIATEVLEAFGPPWWTSNPDTVVGEDIHFFRRAKEAGYQLRVDTACVCGHYVEEVLTVRHFTKWREEHQEQLIYGR